MLGKRWQVSTDVLPLFAIFSASLYALWLVYIVVAYFITVDIHGCNDTGTGRYYLATVTLFFTEYIVSMLVAVCITAIGLRGIEMLFLALPSVPDSLYILLQTFAGTPLEASKRKMMIPFLYLQVVNWLMQLGCLGTASASEEVLLLDSTSTMPQVISVPAGYGTYVVASMVPKYGCWASDHRRNLTRILVYLSWAMLIVLDWCVHLTYNTSKSEIASFCSAASSRS